MAAPDLERLLEELLEPDSDVIRGATARLREAFADPQTPARLGRLLSAAPRPQVRQLAAVLLRRRLLGRWRRLDAAMRHRLPALVAEALERETEHAVTVALAQLGALVLRRGGCAWGPLGTWVQAAARDPPRQEGVIAPPSPLGDWVALLRGGLAPGVPPAPLTYSLRALGGLAAATGGTHTELLRSLLPDILGALRRLIDADEDRGAEALEVLDEFLEADPPAVTPHLRPLLDLCLQVGGDESRGDAVRVRALGTVTFLAQKCPKALLRGGLLPPVLRGLLAPLCADSPPGHPDPEEQEEEEALDALALPLLAEAVGSPRAGARKGGLLGLGALAGGCGEPLRRRWGGVPGQVLGVLRGGLGDPEPSVRGAAAFALRSLAESLQWPVLVHIGQSGLILIHTGPYWFLFAFTGLYSSILAFTGPCCSILACTGPYQYVLVCIGPYWPTVRPLLALTDPSWPLLACIGLYWSVLAHPGPYWPVLACTGPYWSVLARPGPYWPVLACTGPSWPVLTLTGPYWPVLACTGPSWPVLTLTGPYCRRRGRWRRRRYRGRWRLCGVPGGGSPGRWAPPAKAWYILESLLECLGEGGGPWLPAVLEAVLGGLDPAGPPRNLELGLSALHSLACAAGEQLQPHAGPILGALTPLLQPGPPEARPRRLQALGVLGALGRPVAGEGLVPALEMGLALAQEHDEPEGRRVAFVLAGAVAEALGEGVGPLLPRVVPVLLGALQRPPPPPPSEAPDSFLLFDDDDEEEEEPMEDDVSDEEELVEVEVGGAYAEELEEACEALGEVAEHGRAAFLPYVEPSLEAVLPLLQFPQPGLRRAAYETLGSLCLVMGGAPDSSPPDGPGPAPPPALLPPIGRLLADVIKGKVACLEGGASAEDDDDEQAEAEAELRELAGEGLVALGGGRGRGHGPPLRGGAARPIGRPGPAAQRGAALRGRRRPWWRGVGGALGGAVTPFLPRLAPPWVGAATRDPHPEVRANALFAIGRLAEAAGPALGPYPPIGGLSPRPAWPGGAVLAQALAGEGPGRVRDNACGALARHGGALPPDMVVPLVLGALPLGQDLEEEPPVFRYLVGLHQSHPPPLRQHAAELPRACSSVVGSGRLPPELEAGVVGLLRDVWGSCPTAFERGLAQLPPQRRRPPAPGPAPNDLMACPHPPGPGQRPGSLPATSA
ncbi:LOW QUALITY PROTEIN: importin-4 [Rhynochetos jubatus]